MHRAQCCCDRPARGVTSGAEKIVFYSWPPAWGREKAIFCLCVHRFALIGGRVSASPCPLDLLLDFFRSSLLMEAAAASLCPMDTRRLLPWALLQLPLIASSSLLFLPPDRQPPTADSFQRCFSLLEPRFFSPPSRLASPSHFRTIFFFSNK